MPLCFGLGLLALTRENLRADVDQTGLFGKASLHDGPVEVPHGHEELAEDVVVEEDSADDPQQNDETEAEVLGQERAQLLCF